MDKSSTALNRPANLYLERLSDKKYKLIMPNADGSLDGIQEPKDGFAIGWPVNPHFTGPSAIIIMLNAIGAKEYPMLKGCELVIDSASQERHNVWFNSPIN